MADFGKGHAVVLFDLSSKFSVLRLYNVMYDRVSSICSTNAFTLPHEEIPSLISDSLAHLHIFRPQESSTLQATLDSIPSYLLTQHSLHVSANRPLGLVAINDLSAFLWQDRLDADEESDPSITTRKEKANNSLLHQRYRSLVSSLRHIQKLFSCTIVATNWGLASTTSVANHRGLRPHLPSVWDNFCTVRLIVERDRVPRFGPGMSVEEAANERQQRWGAVEQSGFSGRINWWGSENWRDEVREGLGVWEEEPLSISRLLTWEILYKIAKTELMWVQLEIYAVESRSLRSQVLIPLIAISLRLMDLIPPGWKLPLPTPGNKYCDFSTLIRTAFCIPG